MDSVRRTELSQITQIAQGEKEALTRSKPEPLLPASPLLVRFGGKLFSGNLRNLRMVSIIRQDRFRRKAHLQQTVPSLRDHLARPADQSHRRFQFW